MKKNDWHKKGWGLILAIMFLPFFIIWYIWAKTKWSKKLKWTGTSAIIILFFIAVGSSGNQATVSNSKQTKTIPSIEKTTNKPETASTEAKTVENPQTKTTSNNTLYSVVKVVDGDTVDVSINGKAERLRLIGIDTPETVDPRKPVQCFGKEASNKAKELLSGKKVSLEADPTQGERDKYDRLLRFIFLEDRTDFQKLMISEGYAHEYTYNLPYKYMDQYKQAEKTAREASKGLWAANSCNGDTTKAAASTTPSTTTTPPTSSSSSNSSGVVKKSSTGICHAPGTTYYDRTTNYTPFNTVQACLDSGGRLPLR